MLGRGLPSPVPRTVMDPLPSLSARLRAAVDRGRLLDTARRLVAVPS